MLKNLVRVLVLLALIVPIGFSVASAQGPSGTYASGIACVNLDNVAGTFTIDFYDTGGTLATSLANQSIDANGSVLYFTTAIAGLPDGFMGSAVISSDVQLACSVNTQTSAGTMRVGTSNGVAMADTGTKLYATQILNDLGGFSSYVAVQNTSGAAADITARYFDASGTEVFNVTVNVPAYSTHVFYQDGDENGDSTPDLPAGFIGSASFESTANLAGTVALFNAGADAGTAQLLSYNTFTGGATKVYGPRVVKNLSGVGFTSGWSCQNVGAATTDIVATVVMTNQDTNSDVTAVLQTAAVAPGQAWAVYLGSNTGTVLDGVAKGVGSVVITAPSSDIACTFNEDNRTTYAGLGSTYGGVLEGEQSTTMFFAQIVDLGSASFQGGFQIANTTSTDATCTYTFTNAITGATDTVANQALAANGSNSVFASAVLTVDPGNFNGSALVTCDQPIVGIYNMAAFSTAGDSFATNNGINQ